jgi:hypothetical protein
MLRKTVLWHPAVPFSYAKVSRSVMPTCRIVQPERSGQCVLKRAKNLPDLDDSGRTLPEVTAEQ